MFNDDKLKFFLKTTRRQKRLVSKQ